jgi:LmbE family N-acetylglucosaminyl deacetylase
MKILKTHLPSEVYFPCRDDVHRDHRAANEIVRESIKKLELHPLKFEYSIMRKRWSIKPYIQQLSNRFLNLVRHRLVQVDVSEFLPQKKAAISELRSQTAIISSQQEKPVVEDCSHFLRKKEVFIRVRD